VERAPRAIEIRRLQLTGQDADALRLACECTKGTYIRVLGEDIARALGTCGHLTQLRRPWVQPFRDMPMVSLETALAGAAEGSTRSLMPPDSALQGLPQARLAAEQLASLRNGHAVRCATEPAAAIGSRVRLYGPEAEFLGLAEVMDDGRLQPRRLLLAKPS
jgi:tRNA pseudouridine55 synthase